MSELLRILGTLDGRRTCWFEILEDKLPEWKDIIHVREKGKDGYPFSTVKVFRIDQGITRKIYFMEKRT